jgi:hypothetical protein
MSDTVQPNPGDHVRVIIEGDFLARADQGVMIADGNGSWFTIPHAAASVEVLHEAVHGLTGAELYAVLAESDREFVGMFYGCTFGGTVTLPSGRRLSGEQMASVQKHLPGVGGV